MGNLRFSGHETFHCRNLWLKKGYDFIHDNDKGFNDETAVVDLGVGKNMVGSINFWYKAFGFYNNDKLSNDLFSEDGYDPYLEDIGTIWLLHYLLVKTNRASIYSILFNQFRKERVEFTKDHLINYLMSYSEARGESNSENTIEKDVGVFIKNYVRPSKTDSKKNIEDLYSSLLMELGLVKQMEHIEEDNRDWYRFELGEKESLPIEIFLYSILNNDQFGNSISIQSLLNDENAPGNIFLLSPDDLINKIELLVNHYNGLVYKEDAGLKELQITTDFNEEHILEDYYA
ncbi:MAG TPA: DUF4007 family protein [Balneolaceae bacterium]|nr:DUF4007 family protein [Balneolaceae bacterium]